MSISENLEQLTKLMTPAEGEERQIEAAAEHFKAILTALANSETEGEVKVKGLKIVAEFGAYFGDAVKECFKDCMKASVDILCASNEDQPVELAAVEAISGLAMKVTELQASKAELVTRQAVDAIMQVAMDPERKDVVKKAAKNQFTKMVTKSDFTAVSTKLVHWLSDDREDDDVEFLNQERQFALEQLEVLTRPAYNELWTDEVFKNFYKFLGVVMPTITIEEYTRLLAIVAKLPQVKATNSSNLVDLVLGAKYVKADADRVLEMLVLLGANLPRVVRHEGLVKKLQAEIGKITADATEKNTLISKAALIAARAADDAAAEGLVNDVMGALKAVTNNFSTEVPANLSAVDNLLVALHTLGHKSALTFYDAIKVDGVSAGLNTLATNLEEKQKLLVFAIKKKMQDKKVTAGDKLLYGTFLSLIGNAKTTSSSTLLAQPQCLAAFEKRVNLPHIKKSVGGPQANQGGAKGRGSNAYSGPQKRNR